MIFHDFSIPFTLNQKLLPGCWPQYHPRSSHPSSCCGTACVSDKTPRPWKETEICFFWVQTWRLGRFLDICFHFAFCICLLGLLGFFYPNPARVFQKLNDWHVEAEPSRPTQIIMSFKVPWFVPIVKLLYSLSFISEKQKKTSQNATTQTSSPWLLIENGLVQDRNRLVCWATQSPRVTAGGRPTGHPPKEKTHTQTGKSTNFASFLEIHLPNCWCSSHVGFPGV